ncbi:MAG: multifunctional oxoglutarate decarboxylase/oxoglutarate dehydrogenase thiamine pyrophosphate-binding subunit/dihydrolipoyllysine-residue succinyltransferase subunit [Candidatus Xenobia bacterium]
MELDLNAAYLTELYHEYLKAPEGFDEQWKAFFAEMFDGQHVAPAPEPKTVLPPGAELLSGVALRIAQNMQQSLTVPAATSYWEIPVKLLEENRTLINSFLTASDRGKLSFTHLIGWALVHALKSVPGLNHAYTEVDGKPAILRRDAINLGIAVDMQRGSSRSLVVPNIKGAQQMTFADFYDAYETAVHKARENKLSPDDLTGTTVTLTNPGTIGTLASVPRLMAGQGTIIATGGINYPAAYQAADVETLSELGVSKVMMISSTYDHRIIQGAESGRLLARMQALLQGQDDFYEDIFRSLQIPYRPLAWQKDRRTDPIERQARALQLIAAYRERGHLLTHLDPLGYELHYHPDLDLVTYGFSIWDLDRKVMTDEGQLPLRSVLQILRDTYTQRIGVEYMHIQDPQQKGWLQTEMEHSRNQPRFSVEEKRRTLRKLSEAEMFERFLATKYLGHKRFSLEGAETAICMLDELVRRAAHHGVAEIMLGMAHRGRLNVLANIIGKSPQRIFAEFEDLQDPASVHGSGDVKYHLGARGVMRTEDGAEVSIWLSPNPSHLEAVDPVVEGMTRAHQDQAGEGGENRYVPVLIHGDAAFAGQGVVAETLNMSQLEGYRTGGTVHLVINNQIGFTAAPKDTRSMRYATDIARMVDAPIFHVNGDDPEAAVYAMRLAFDYRQRFHQDVVIDLVCYRRHGHNETDDPSYTQPIMYRKIRSHSSTRLVYMDRLVRTGKLTRAEVDAVEKEFSERLEALLAATRAQTPPEPTGDALAEAPPEAPEAPPATAIPSDMLGNLLARLSTIPTDLDVHPKLKAMVEKRHTGNIEWALAEALAFGALLLEGRSVRLSGQDAQRGTFSQRHAVLHDQTTGRAWTQLAHLAPHQGRLWIYDSPLSEFAPLGFEYGYAVAAPETLVLWEAQFGDFVNGAQIVIDQFLSSGEDKWGQTSGVTLLLPHGFEGQGPEHSSARLERFLTLCAEDNLRIAVPTTAAQYFHLLRRQALSTRRKPLIVLTPKSLLRHPKVASPSAALTTGGFEPVLPDRAAARVVLCTGKVYYDLLASRQNQDVALVRVEQLYPFPAEQIRAAVGNATDVLWVQEEPRNMGAWPLLRGWLGDALQRPVRFLGRPASGSPAAGSARQHAREQQAIIAGALH